MKRLFLLIFSIAIGCGCWSQNKNICITVDDLPTVTYGSKDMKWYITKSLTQKFKTHQVPAIGYVNESKLYKEGPLDSAQLEMLGLWFESGLELGNHTFSHFNFHKVPFQTFAQDITRGEQLIKPLAARYHQEIKFFRHPYLRAGLSQSHADSLKNFLTDHGYTEAPVTIDNEDYLFAKAYDIAFQKQDESLMRKIGEAYVGYMKEKLLFYENMANRLFNRNISQTLLIHASLLNADYIDELIELYKQEGYAFVSQANVLKDSAYQHDVTVFGNWGISWIDRWALSQGKKGDFFEGDPKTPDFIKNVR